MKHYLKNTKCVTEVPDVLMQNATENTLLTLTPLFFPDNLGAAGDEQVERCRQDVARIEYGYQGKWDPFIWEITAGLSITEKKRQPKERK